ncbi:MAG: PAS domain S-box protein [Chloroflexi bacterium]|nr:PAS domain S-box protein [Chloroflexota bacterium]
MEPSPVLQQKIDRLESIDQQMRSLLRLAERLQLAHTANQIIEAVLPEVKTILHYQTAWLYLYHHDGTTATLLTASGLADKPIIEQYPQLLIIGDPFLEEIAAADHIVIVPDARNDPRTNKEIVAQLGNRTIVNSPLRLVNNRIGALGMGSFGDEGILIPTTDQLDYLITMSLHVTVAIERVQWLEERQLQSIQLQESEERYRQLVEFSPIPISLYIDNKVVYANPAALELIGATDLEQVKGRPVASFIHPDSLAEMAERQIRLMAGERLETVEQRIICLDGQVRDIQVVTNAITYQGQPAAMAIFEDITLRKRMLAENARLYAIEQERAKALTEALIRQQELDRLKSEFIQNVSHELRTPLTVAMGYVDLVADGIVGELSHTQHAMLQSAQNRLYALYQIVMDLTTLSVLEQKNKNDDPTNLGELVVDVVADFQALAQQKSICLNAEIDTDVPLIRGNSIHLWQMLENLLSNALKFTPEAGSVVVRLQQTDTHIILEMADTGIGIASDQFERIFERFYQVDGSMTRRYGGTGLGLALVRQIAEARCGRVAVESQPGQGSTFRVSFPALEITTVVNGRALQECCHNRRDIPAHKFQISSRWSLFITQRIGIDGNNLYPGFAGNLLGQIGVDRCANKNRRYPIFPNGISEFGQFLGRRV